MAGAGPKGPDPGAEQPVFLGIGNQKEGATMYAITVQLETREGVVSTVYDVPEYEISNGVLTLALAKDHDLVIPLFHVPSVDMQRHD